MGTVVTVYLLKSLNSKVYSEFCVPAFKKYRGEQVKVVGILSPYFVNVKSSYLRVHWEPPRVLGGIHKSKLVINMLLVMLTHPGAVTPDIEVSQCLF